MSLPRLGLSGALLVAASALAAPPPTPVCADVESNFLYANNGYDYQYLGKLLSHACGQWPNDRQDTPARVARATALLSAFAGIPCRLEKPDRTYCAAEAYAVNIRCQCVDPDGPREFGATLNCYNGSCYRTCHPDYRDRCVASGRLLPVTEADVPAQHLSAPPLTESTQTQLTRAYIGTFKTDGKGIAIGNYKLAAIDTAQCESERLKGNFAEFVSCVALVATLTGRAEDCLAAKKYPDEGAMGRCAQQLAATRGNVKACFYLSQKPPDRVEGPAKDHDRFTSCLTHGLSQSPSREGCMLLRRTVDADPSSADDCFYKLGLVTKDLKDCDRIIGRGPRNACIQGIAKALKKPELCREMHWTVNDQHQVCVREAGAPAGYVPQERPRASLKAGSADDAIAKLSAVSPPPTTGGDTLRVALSGNYWPLHLSIADKRYGFEADIADTLAKELGRPLQFLGREELGVGSLEAVAQGKADFAISSITPTEERRKLVDFTRPYTYVPYALVQARSTSPVTRLEELAGKNVAVPKGAALADLKSTLGGATVVEADSLTKALQLLRKKKVEYVAGESLALTEVMDATQEMFAPVTLGRSALALAVPKGSAATWDATLKKIDPALKEFEALYRPGVEVTDAIFKSCSSDEGHAAVSNGVVRSAEAPPAGKTVWFVIDWSLQGAPPERAYSGSGEEEHLCVTMPVRVSQAVPKALTRAIAGAMRSLTLEYGGKDEKPGDARVIHKARSIDVEQQAPGAIKLANGAWLTALKWTLSQECVETDQLETGADGPVVYDEFRRWSCPAEGYYLISMTGDGVTHTQSFVTKKARDSTMDAPVSR